MKEAMERKVKGCFVMKAMERKVKGCFAMKVMEQKMRGYFTVEAAMVLPMVMIFILWMIYLWFFQYNRCLMEQDAGALALQGAALQSEDNEDRMRQLREMANQVYGEKYIAWENGEMELKIEKGMICVKQKGRIRFPFGSLIPGTASAETTAVYENDIISPVHFIRSYRKMMGG